MERAHTCIYHVQNTKYGKQKILLQKHEAEVLKTQGVVVKKVNDDFRAEIQGSLPNSQETRTSSSTNDFESSQEPDADDFLPVNIAYLLCSIIYDFFLSSY